LALGGYAQVAAGQGQVSDAPYLPYNTGSTDLTRPAPRAELVEFRIARPGPLGVVIAVLIGAALAGALLLMTGIVLIVVAAAGLLIVGATVSGLLRRLFRQ
jgi:hypothetical protein